MVERRRRPARTRSLRFSALRAAAASIAVAASSGCFTYSSYQSARIVERGDHEGTVSLSRSSVVSENTGRSSWLAVEGLARFGIAERFDGSLMVSVFRGVPESWGAGVVTADVRAGIIKDRLACSLPVSITVGDLYLASFRVQPGLIGTIPLGPRLEITGAIRAHVFVRVPDLFAVGYNAGLGITSASGTWTLRPEVGWMQFVETEAQERGVTYAQFGIGLERHSGNPPTTKEQKR